MGVGVGGYVLALHSIKYPEHVFGLILLSPAFQRASWLEWSFGSAVLWYLNLRGKIDSRIADHVIQRLTTGRSSDLTQTLKHAIQEMSPSGLWHYFNAALARSDLTSEVQKLKVKRLLLLWGYEALYKQDSQEMNRAFPFKDRLGWAEIDACGNLLTEECPFRILEEMQFYTRALQTQGHCLEWTLDAL